MKLMKEATVPQLSGEAIVNVDNHNDIPLLKLLELLEPLLELLELLEPLLELLELLEPLLELLELLEPLLELLELLEPLLELLELLEPLLELLELLEPLLELLELLEPLLELLEAVLYQNLTNLGGLDLGGLRYGRILGYITMDHGFPLMIWCIPPLNLIILSVFYLRPWWYHILDHNISALITPQRIILG
jgi:tetratricopeptide (TPR) repeat protein